jgi:hypothetical protein
VKTLGFRRRNSAEKRGNGNRLQFVAKEQYLMLTSKRAVFALVLMLVFGASVSVSAVERVLAGIKLGSPAQTVLQKYGNPTRIDVGTRTSGGSSDQAAAQQQQAPPGTVTLPTGNQKGNPLAQMGQTYQSYANEALGGEPAGLQSPGGAQGQPQNPQQPAIVEQQVLWTYELQNGITLEFIISDSGRVVQVTVGGDQPFALSKTSKGIKIGSYYKDVIFKYGYPEKQVMTGRFLRASYADKHRCVFTFLGKKLVGVTIAFKSDDAQ